MITIEERVKPNLPPALRLLAHALEQKNFAAIIVFAEGALFARQNPMYQENKNLNYAMSHSALLAENEDLMPYFDAGFQIQDPLSQTKINEESVNTIIEQDVPVQKSEETNYKQVDDQAGKENKSYLDLTFRFLQKSLENKDFDGLKGFLSGYYTAQEYMYGDQENTRQDQRVLMDRLMAGDSKKAIEYAAGVEHGRRVANMSLYHIDQVNEESKKRVKVKTLKERMSALSQDPDRAKEIMMANVVNSRVR
ncbi:hypothetical protein SAMN05444392_103208 [Seinonella peptonophila]|uniref:Uncharacterized protein n=1 Tax=Seinonella peptonophila TaxID=112248 RepID=A0A1M4WGC3_9BACL|nr:hypothetical protein [Seinonella peptonophila]SHE80264.1 hypothetical protein SAMN05444392_103208 [Seinonella peptonophila]